MPSTTDHTSNRDARSTSAGNDKAVDERPSSATQYNDMRYENKRVTQLLASRTCLSAAAFKTSELQTIDQSKRCPCSGFKSKTATKLPRSMLCSGYDCYVRAWHAVGCLWDVKRAKNHRVQAYRILQERSVRQDLSSCVQGFSILQDALRRCSECLVELDQSTIDHSNSETPAACISCHTLSSPLAMRSCIRYTPAQARWASRLLRQLRAWERA